MCIIDEIGSIKLNEHCKKNCEKAIHILTVLNSKNTSIIEHRAPTLIAIQTTSNSS